MRDEIKGHDQQTTTRPSSVFLKPICVIAVYGNSLHL
jgi:hypothetical protein